MQPAPCGTWESPITAAMVAGTQLGLGYPAIVDDAVWWTEGRPVESGRVALMREVRGRIEEITPASFNARTRINEYGGRPFAVADGVVVAVAFTDQRVWRLDGTPRPITPDTGGTMRYGDLRFDVARRRLLAVREDTGGAGEPRHSIVAIPLEGGEVRVLADGADFYAAPSFSPDGSTLAWLEWNHPDMPWDAAAVWVREGEGPARRVAGGHGTAALQPGWLADGRLAFALDEGGLWRLHAWNGERVELIDAAPVEQAGPLWVLGQSWWAEAADRRVVSARVKDGSWRLAVDARELDLPFVEIADVTVAGHMVAARVGFADRPPQVVAIDLDTGEWRTVREAGPLAVNPAFVSRARAIEVGGVHAFHYPPANPDHAVRPGELPPLIVRTHGGPTSMATPALKLSWQFWTSRGFAVVDVNYRGSTGWGRAYREALNGAWGIADVEDCVAVAAHLAATGQADPARTVIAGGSAGGYTTLCALTFTDAFRAGASWYGIGDLETLARDTHKFESRYLDRLVGPWPQAADTYRARSPIHHIDLLRTPVLFLQGSDDKVVPPSQAEAMVAALREKGVPVEYRLFEGEGHGFRRADTQIEALEAELAFYRRVLGLD